MKNKKSIIVFVIFGIFGLCQFLQFSHVFLYFDDFGYASLSYVNLTDHVGLATSFEDIFTFLVNHYFQWGGRVVCFFFLVILLQNVWLARLAVACMALGTVYVLYLVLKDRYSNHTYLCLGIPMIVWGLISVQIMADSVYWFTAALIYLFPLPFLITGIRLYHDFITSREAAAKKYIWMNICLAIAAFSQEQISIMTLSGIACLTIMERAKGNPLRKTQIGTGAIAFLGLLFVVLAPGNFVRMSQSVSTDTMRDNLVSLTQFVGTFNVYKIFVIFMLAAIIADLRFLKSMPKKRWKKTIIAVHLVISICAAVVMIYERDGLLVCLEKIIPWNMVCLAAMWGYLVYTAGCLICFYFCRKDSLMFSVWLMAMVSLGLFIVTGSISNRVLFPFIILITILIADNVIAGIAEQVLGEYRWILACALIGISILSLRNWVDIYQGYAANAIMQEENDRILNSFRRSETVENIYLRKNADDRYSNIMPYFDNYEFVESFYKRYYELPDCCRLIWK